MLSWCQVVPRALPVGPETGYQLTARLVEDGWTDATRAVIAATPSNPTGTLISEKELTDIHQIVSTRGGSLIVDEIYQGLVYGAKEFTALSIADDIFVINSFSKYYGMTGWRLGWLVAPESYVDSLDCLAQNIFLSCSAPAQYAGLKAFGADCREILESRRLSFQQRRDYLVPALQELGFEIPVVPEGAFYLYANCSGLTDDSFTFAYDLLENQGVAITPGKDFGNNKPQEHVRFAYTTTIENMKEAMKRIRRYIS